MRDRNNRLQQRDENSDDRLSYKHKVAPDTNDSCGHTAAKSLTIIDALDYVQQSAHKSGLSEQFLNKCSNEIAYLCERLGMSDKQVVLLAIMSEIGEGVSWRRIGDFLGLSRLKTMSLTSEIEGLREKRWIYKCVVHERGSMYEGHKLVYGVIKAFRHDQTFVPENIEGLSLQAFVDRLTRYICTEGNNNNIPDDEKHHFMLQLTDFNQHLPLCRLIRCLHDELSQITMLLEISDYARFAGTDDEGICLHELSSYFESSWELEKLADELQGGTHELFKRGIFEHGCEDGLIDTERFVLTSKAKDELLGEYSPHRRRSAKERSKDRDLREYSEIEEKAMFYNHTEQMQIERLESLLSRDGLDKVQERLKESGLRRGITCLFYGAPGTGKTETVLQLARKTGRDIMQIDIATLRDKFVGQSEKNIKGIFSRYKALCAGCATTPILFFNEADAIINSRFEKTRSSVEKMDNVMQNILLQEIENLDGILIATTNLTGTLDKAFDRRFLFKIEFSKPSLKAKESIWHCMLPDISIADCHALASEYDFSGGQIENIARKCKIEYALSGLQPSLLEIREFCNDEYLNRDNRSRIGFLSDSL